MKKAVYPGSFDPLTNGHLDIILRSSKLFQPVIVAVVVNPQKNSTFTLEERVEMIQDVIEQNGLSQNVQVDSFYGLLVNYMKKSNSDIIIRGLRAISDFDSEFQLAQMNRNLNQEVDTIFLPTGELQASISSSLIKEVFKLGGNISSMVPKAVLEAMQRKIKTVSY